MTISLAHNDIVPLSNTIRNLTVRVATAQQGFRGYLFLIDRAGSEAVSIGFWDSHEAMLQSEASGFLPQALRRLEPFLAAPPAIEYFGVSARANLGVERGGGRVCQIDYASLTDFTVNDIIGQFQQRVEQRRQETNQLCRAVLLLHLISGQAMAIGMWQENDAPRAPEGLGGAMSDLESAALIAPARSRRYHVALEV